MGFFARLLGVTPEKAPVHVEDATFQELVIRSKLPVILDVWGPNCAPCKQLEPVLRSLGATYDGRVTVCEMNARLAPRACAQLRIKSTPTVVYFRRGREVERIVGMRGSLYHEEAIAEVFGIPKTPE